MRKNKIFTLILIFANILVFKQYFNLSNDLVWGDAPYFYHFKQLLGEPSSWVYRDDGLGGINRFLWISPLMLLYGFIGQFINNNAILVRLFFYFPSLILASSGAYLFSIKNNFKNKYAVLSSLIYTLNPYYLMLVDGGTVGVALAYGLFPWAVMSLRHFLSRSNHKTFLLATLINFVLTIVDPRIFIIALLFSLLFPTDSKKPLRLKIINLASVAAPILLLSSYWLYPLFKTSSDFFTTSANSNTYDITYPFMLTHPFWPTNIFGQVNLPSFLFIYFPAILSLPFIFKTKHAKKYAQYLILFLLFALLAKGSGRPFGSFYSLILKLPLAQAFRDASKFYMPLLLVYSLLLAFIISQFKKLYYPSLLIILFIALPVLKSVPSGSLGRSKQNQDVITISQKITDTKARALWFPSVHPYAINNNQTNSISASSLVNYRPFARLNGGTYDKFNFLYHPESKAWLAYINTHYLALIDDPRHPVKDKTEQEHWDALLNLVAKQDYLHKISNHNNNLLYKFEPQTSYLNVYDKAYFVIGPDSIYKELITDDYQIANNLLIFVNQPGFNNSLFTEIEDKSAAELVFYHTRLEDLILNLTSKDSLLSVSDAQAVDWAVRLSDQYLTYKYEILTKGKNFSGFDLGKGVAFSTKPDEKISFSQNIKAPGDYKIALRGMFDASGSAKLKITDSQNKITSHELKPATNLAWQVFEIFLTAGEAKIDVINSQGVQIFNTLGLISKDDYNQASALAQAVTTDFNTIYIGSDEELSPNLFKSQTTSLIKSSTIPSKFELSGLKNYSWVVFTDSYNSGWMWKKDYYEFHSVPANTIGNAIYKPPSWDKVEIEFSGQKDFRWGVYFSVISFLLIGIIYLLTLEDKHGKN